MTRILIDLRSGVIEAEGEESFVRAIYDEYKSRLASQEVKITPLKSDGVKAPSIKSTDVKKKANRGVSKKTNNLKMLGDINLTGLKDFYDEKRPSNGFENNVVFIYFLQNSKHLEEITPSHIYTCYKTLGLRTPTAVKQSLLDTSHRRGWIDTTSLEDLKVTIAGENYVEHDMPKQGKGE